MGEVKWYLGIRIRQYKDHIILDQDQYVKNITSRFEYNSNILLNSRTHHYLLLSYLPKRIVQKQRQKLKIQDSGLEI